MPRRKGRKAYKPARLKRHRAKVAIVIVLVLTVIATATMFAKRPGISLFRRSPQIAPASLQAGSPSKEYIYVGGRLVATEEPVSVSILPPSGLEATADSTTQVTLHWTGSGPGVDHYEVERKQQLSGAWTPLGPPHPTSTTFTDTSASGGVTYLYRVRAAAIGGGFSDYSNIDLATTIIFFEDPVMAGVTLVQAVHVEQLRQAVNAVRMTAELPAASWTDPSLQGVVIKAVHINELRSSLDPALSALGFGTGGYTDQPVIQNVTTIMAVHVNEIRQRVK